MCALMRQLSKPLKLRQCDVCDVRSLCDRASRKAEWSSVEKPSPGDKRVTAKATIHCSNTHFCCMHLFPWDVSTCGRAAIGSPASGITTFASMHLSNIERKGDWIGGQPKVRIIQA